MLPRWQLRSSFIVLVKQRSPWCSSFSSYVFYFLILFAVMIRHRLPRQTTPSRSSSSSRLSELKEYMLRRGCWLGTLCVVVIVVMTIGVVFTAHQYYHDFGGQGWLKSRTQHREGNSNDKAQLYLPMRQIQMFRKPAFWERQEGDDIPFYTCGDQRNSCASFNQPVSLLLLYKSLDMII